MTLLEQLQTLAPLAAAATAGPWETYTDYTGWDGDPDTVAKPYETLVLGPSWSAQIGPNEWEGGSGPFICTTGTDPQEGAPDEDVPNAEPNAAFIAQARNVLTAEYIAQLIAALTPAPAVTGWVSVADGLPEPEEGYTEFSPWVLAYTTRGQQIQASYYGPLKGWRTPTGRADVTHWMPQPTPPATMEGAPTRA